MSTIVAVPNEEGGTLPLLLSKSVVASIMVKGVHRRMENNERVEEMWLRCCMRMRCCPY